MKRKLFLLFAILVSVAVLFTVFMVNTNAATISSNQTGLMDCGIRSERFSGLSIMNLNGGGDLQLID